MKIKSSYKVRNIAGENIVVNLGQLNVNKTKIIVLNEVALQLWNRFYDTDFTLADVSGFLVEEYSITPEQGEQDAAKWVDKLKEAGLIDE